jgi:transposase-like protein
MNRKADYDLLEREYRTGDMSLRELARRHGITNHSTVMEYSKKHEWVRKRAEYRAQKNDMAVTYMADQEGLRLAREAQVRDNAIDAIDEAITKMRSDMQRTEKRMVNGEWVEAPVMLIKPADLATLIDRLNVLFGRPANITEERKLGVDLTGPVSPDILRGIVEATRGISDTGSSARSPFPRVGGPRKN